MEKPDTQQGERVRREEEDREIAVRKSSLFLSLETTIHIGPPNNEHLLRHDTQAVANDINRCVCAWAAFYLKKCTGSHCIAQSTTDHESRVTIEQHKVELCDRIKHPSLIPSHFIAAFLFFSLAESIHRLDPMIHILCSVAQAKKFHRKHQENAM